MILLGSLKTSPRKRSSDHLYTNYDSSTDITELLLLLQIMPIMLVLLGSKENTAKDNEEKYEITAKDDKENDENKESETDTEDEESEIESSEIDSESSLYNLHDLNPKKVPPTL